MSVLGAILGSWNLNKKYATNRSTNNLCSY